MRRLHPVLPVTVLPLAICLGCNDFPVEHCVAGQGVGLDSTDAPLLGPAQAPVEVVIFGDLQCPYTRYALWIVLDYLTDLEESPEAERVQLRFRHLPLEQIHPRARAAALALAAAHRQGDPAFWQLLRLLTLAEDLSDDTIRYFAAQVGLDLAAWEADWAGPAAAKVVDRDLGVAADLMLPGTPSFLICGVPASYDPEEVIANVDAILEQ
jgi:protein-disulfide isomerase